MLCDRCHENEAVVSIVEITDGKEQTLNLCRECAAKSASKGITVMHLPGSSFLGDILAGMLGLDAAEEEKEPVDRGEDRKKNNIVCPTCGRTYDEFMKYGTFGCPDCYKTFSFLLDGYMKKVQESSQHAGKHPRFSGETVHIPDIELADSGKGDKSSGQEGPIAITVDRDSSIEELKAALKRAVDREEYEDAARIRDMIRACEGETGNA